MLEWMKDSASSVSQKASAAYNSTPHYQDVSNRLSSVITSIKNIDLEKSLNEYGLDKDEAVQIAAFLEKKLIFCVVGGVCVATFGPFAGPAITFVSKTALSSYVPEDKLVVSEIASYMKQEVKLPEDTQVNEVDEQKGFEKTYSQIARDKAFAVTMFVEKKLVPSLVENTLVEYIGAPEIAAKASKLVVQYVNSQHFVKPLQSYYESYYYSHPELVTKAVDSNTQFAHDIAEKHLVDSIGTESEV